MKHLTLVISLFLLLDDCLAQDTTFIHLFHAPGIETNEAMVQSENGDFILTGSTSSNNLDDTDIHLLRLDEDLNLIWSKPFGDDFISEKGKDIAADNDSNVIVAGITNQFGYDLKLIKVDASGNLIWERTHGSDDWDFVEQLALDNDGNILVCGYSYAQPTMGTQAWLVAFDEEGNFLWEEFYGDEGDDEFNAIQITPENKILLGGKKAVNEGADFTTWMLQLDTETNVEWEFTGTTNEEFLRDFTITNNGISTFCSSFNSEGNEVIRSYTLDFDGSLTSVLPGFTEGNNFHIASCLLGDDLVGVVGGTDFYGVGGMEIRLDTYDSQGNAINATSIGGFEDDFASDILLAENQRMYISSYTHSFASASLDVMIIHDTQNFPTDANEVIEVHVDDNLITSITERNEPDQESIVIYPNPAIDYIRFREQTEQGSVAIYTARGRFLKSAQIDSGESLFVGDLKPGAYLLKFAETSGRTLHSGFIIE